MEATSMSIDRGMDKEEVVHIHNGILLSHKKNEITPFIATWMLLEILILNEVRKRDRNHSPYMCNVKHGTHELIYKAETES